MIKHSSSSVRRKTFVAREDLLNRLAEVAKTRGCSLFELVNELFQLEIDSAGVNLSLKKVADERQRLESAKHSGFMLGLENVWYDMADLAYDKNKRLALKSWFDAGVWFATRYVTEGDGVSLNTFRGDLSAFTWNAPELQLEQMENQVLIRVISPRFTEAYTFLFASFLMGAMQTFGYKPSDQEVTRGVIRLGYVKEEGHGSTQGKEAGLR